jgi:hypothetical protein
MTLRVSCPFCNTGFDVPATLPAARIPCPRCGEAVAVKVPDGTGLPQPSLNGDGVHAARPVVMEPPAAPSGLKPLLLLGAALFAVVVVGIGVWLSDFVKRPDPKPEQAKPGTPRATWPPQTLAGLRYLPSDSHLVFAVQPSPLLQYAERTTQDANKVLAEGGLPKPVFDWLNEAGITPDQIDHVAVGVKFEGLVPPFAVLLALRQPLDDEGKFLARLKAKRNPDKNLYTLHIAALIADVSLVKVDATKYLFALREEDLAPAKRPAEGGTHFRKDLQDSIQKLSPSSFFWLATDSHDWKANKTLEFLATVGMGQGDRLTKFDPKLRATAVGLSLDGELTVRVSTRYIDAPTATEREKGWKELLAASKGESAVEGVWATASVPLNPTDACGKVLKRVFTP